MPVARGEIQEFDLSTESSFDLSTSSDDEKVKVLLSDFNVLAIFPDGRTSDDTAFKRAINLIKIDAGNRLILGSNPLNDWLIANGGDFLDNGRNKLEIRNGSLDKGLVLAIDWNADCGSNGEFIEKAKKVWGGPPNRVYALSYEAVQAITDRLRRGKVTRADILNDLSDSKHKVTSDVFQNKTISFVNGDRDEIENRILVTPYPSGEGTSDFKAVPGQVCPPS